MNQLPAATQVQTVDRQIRAYNRRDLDDFLSCYADSVDLLMDGTVVASGKEALRDAYAKQFTEDSARAVVVDRIHFAEWVVDNERIDGENVPAITVLALYRVRDGLIDRVQFLGHGAEA